MKVIFDCHTIIIAKNLNEFEEIFNFVNLHLKYKNPKFEMSENNAGNEKEFYELFEVDFKNFIFKLPKNIKQLINALLKIGIKIDSFENNRINKNEQIGFKAAFEPRDEQQENSIKNFFDLPDKHGTLGALCGFG